MSLMQVDTTIYNANSNRCESEFFLSVHEQNEQDFYNVIDLIQSTWGNNGNTISAHHAQDSWQSEEDSLRLNIIRCPHNAIITKVSKGNKQFKVEVEIDRYGAQSLKYVTVTLPINHWLSILENNWLDTLVDFLENTKRGGMSEHRMNKKITDLMDYFYNYMLGNQKPVAMFTYYLPFDGRNSYCVECESEEQLYKFEQVINLLAQLRHDGSSIEYNGQVIAYPNYKTNLFIAVNLSLSSDGEIDLVKPSRELCSFRDLSNDSYKLYVFSLPIDYWYTILTEGYFTCLMYAVYNAEKEGYSKDWINDNFINLVEDVLNNN